MTLQEQIKKLKGKLNQELAKDDSDNNVILQLSHEIAALDENIVRFSVDAGVINRLGRELVGKEETAVSELVKNAYDADALSVSVAFANCDKAGGSLIIDDDGLGMTKQQLINGFMTISSSDKIHNPRSFRYNRIRAGQKGIGRFATQRLGLKLTIITQTLSESFASKVSINWDDFSSDANLLLIRSRIERVEKQKPEGTILMIDDLREAWSEHTIKKAFRFVSELLQPFPLSSAIELDENAPGFDVSFTKDGESVIDIQSAFYEHALAVVEGKVDAKGVGSYTFKSDKLDYPKDVFYVGKNERDDPYSELKNIRIKAYYFIFNSGKSRYLPKLVNTYIKENSEEYGGIRLYRNGFRVLPYALKDDDWLGLDASVRRRSIIAPHGNNNFYGFVEVVDPTGAIFQERSSREGLIENPAFRELQDFGYKMLTDVAIKISFIRERKGTANQKGWSKKSVIEIIDEAKKQVEDLLNISVNLSAQNGGTDGQHYDDEQVVSNDNDLIAALQKVDELIDDVKIAHQEESIEKDELLREVQLLRILAGLGLTIGEFVHEINHYNPALKYDAEQLARLAITSEQVNAGLRLVSNLQALTIYTAYFQKAISENANRELKSVELRDAVLDFMTVIQPDIERSHINLDKPTYDSYNLWTLPMHKSEWASILFNLYTNSKKAIVRANVRGHLNISGGSFLETVFLEFSDNGDGIPEKDRENVFQSFFTTSAPVGNSSTEIEELTGTGLGLKIVNDIIEGYGGKIYLTDPKPGFSTTFRIELPKINTKP
ncbi:MAG: sensor histidine kinase [Bacteroidota bacterium]